MIYLDKYETEEISDQLRWWRNRPNSVHMHLDIEKLKGMYVMKQKIYYFIDME